MSAFLMHWITPLVTLIIAIVLQKVIASKAGGNSKFIIPILYLVIVIIFDILDITSLASTIIFIVLGEFFIILQGFKSDRAHDETD